MLLEVSLQGSMEESMVPPTFLPHSLGSSGHLHCVAAKIQHQLEPTFPDMWQQKQQRIM